MKLFKNKLSQQASSTQQVKISFKPQMKEVAYKEQGGYQPNSHFVKSSLRDNLNLIQRKASDATLNGTSKLLLQKSDG